MDRSNSDWRLSLHYFDTTTVPTQTLLILGRKVETLKLDASQLTHAFPKSFDDFVAAMNVLAGGYAEGDGSFGLLGQNGGWKICGNIYERYDSIQYVELIGNCPRLNLTEFVARLGAESQNCVFQDLLGGYFQSLEQFCRAEDL